jgi:ubiquinol-cytochrome c reductase cytochrome c subunit
MKRLLWLTAIVMATLGAGAGVAATQPAPPGPPPPPSEDIAAGRALYETGCSSCHGLNGEGASLGPPVIGVGAASADFYLSSGRMPLDQPRVQADRKQPAYDPEEIRKLVAYVASLGDGPPIPSVDLGRGDLAVGNQLYSVNCAGCHNSAGSGGALGQAVYAPPVSRATPVQVAEAIRVGPGAMPIFGPDTLNEDDLASIVRYVEYLKDPRDPGGTPLGRVGPIPEGLVAWIVGVGMLLVVARWIGTTR